MVITARRPTGIFVLRFVSLPVSLQTTYLCRLIPIAS